MRLDNAPAAVLLLVVIGIVAAIGAKITNQVSTGMTGVAQGAAANATLGIGEFAGFLPTIGLVVAASVIIGLVLMAFAFGKQ